jgi:hypothetical protein
MRDRLGARDRVRPLLTTLGSTVAGEDFVAVHMTWGAINEWSTRAGYARLSAAEGNPELSRLLIRIMRQESRHIGFYASEARVRLAASPRARRLTRWALHRLWAPVGSGVMPAAETAFLIRHLFSGPDGRREIARIDTDIDQLPGLAGLRLVTRAARRYGLDGAAAGTNRPPQTRNV